ncbi:zf-TFIIB domain-containing protein [Isoptericola sp. NPDC057653]|uniref:TFIIB-type zinc ribbon-containing protein n=1 Tax=Isoptericola sp. NPDC057653 TaxID=3346195 RepID=UPI0036CECF53
MQCPHDQSVLVMTERKGVEIDYCPTCRGVWLDRGELDKIIDRSMEAEIAAEAGSPVAAAEPAYGGPAAPAYPPRYDDRAPDPRVYDDRRYDDRRDDRRYDEKRHDDRGYDPRYRKRKKKESWLEDLFDF